MDLSLGQLGMASLWLAFALAIYGIFAGILGALRRDARLQTSARFAAVAVFLAVTTAIAVMETALLTDDFSVRYVAEHSRIASPLWVKVVTLWSALEGSVLFWGWLLTGYGALLAITSPNNVLRPWALSIMQMVQLFFISVVTFIANPFIVMAVPPMDGPGANPLLQNHWMMAVHPVLLYLGYVGLTVPFAFAMAALITRRPGIEWMTQTRTWTLIGWGFLSAGIIAGGWWSYEVLGWGGYWAWDPVENVSFMPWLTATAFIHSVQVQERRRMLKSWNVMLIVLTFSLSILGTFLIRSGVVSSVHAFGDGPVGPFFLAFFIVVALAAFGLVAWRWDQVRDNAELDAAVSREGSFLAGNVLFLAMAFAVLLGTLFPLIVEALSGNKVTVGAPFFDKVSIPIWLLIFVLMGIGPLLPWRKAEEQSLRKNLMWLVGGALAAALIAFLFGIRRVYPLLTIALAGFNLVSLGLLITGAVVPRARLSGRNVLSVFRQYAFESKRRFGSMIVHFGVIVIALGVLGSGAYRVDQQIRIDYGQSVEFQGYELKALGAYTYPELSLLQSGTLTEQDVSHISLGANVEVWRNGKLLKVLNPRINRFLGRPEQPVPTPSVLYMPWHDIYLNIAGELNADSSSVTLRVVQSPLVTWIWIGGFIIVLGTAYALSPNRRRVKASQEARGSVQA
ncbi:MAG: heme lyase CcmF/NrfE family subunit [Trueperaceae bacterium]|nr:heme lyase CcmF/NrfE family subunit [Trueperaceae bacterium]